MKIDSILLAIDGSIYSRFAADCATQLALTSGASVTTVHVLDLKKVWEAVGFDDLGFLSRSEYVNEFESLSLSLCNLGHKLLQAYAMEAEGAGIAHEALLENNDPYNTVCKLAIDYDLVIIGHRPYLDNMTRTKRSRISFAESLAHGCPKPLLIVQAPITEMFTSLMAAVSMDHVNAIYLNSALDFSDQFGIAPSVVCISTGANEVPVEEFCQNLGQLVPRFDGIPMIVESLGDMAKQDALVEDFVASGYPWENWTTPLLIVPTREIAGQRLTLVNSSPEMFVRYTSLPAIMLYPEDPAHLIDNPMTESVVVNP